MKVCFDMETLDCWDAIQMAMEYYEKDSITVYDLNMWVKEYQEKNPNVYVEHTRDDIAHEHGCGRIYWEITDVGSDIIHRQEHVYCPVCGNHMIQKYPKVEKFEEIKKNIEVFNNEKEKR